jgi:acylphosphatase
MAHQRLRFEVFGKVQRVFFRKFTAEKATTLGLRGWCKNEPHGTVVGEAVGAPEAIAQFQHWLRHEGSPQSQISDAKFVLEEATDEHKKAHTSFEVHRKPK